MSDDISPKDTSPAEPPTPKAATGKRGRPAAAAAPQPQAAPETARTSVKKEPPMAEDKPKSFEEAAQDTVKAAEETVKAAEATLREKVKDAGDKTLTKAKEVAEDVQERFEDTPFDEFIEHQRKAATEVGMALESLIPQGFLEHGEAAVKEAIEGYRRLFNSVIDGVVSTIEKAKLEEDAEAAEIAKKPKVK
jgi:gas vesicle protein